jgi:membrane-associated phospholipid phosphatase
VTSTPDLLPITPVRWTRVLLAMALAIAVAHLGDTVAWEHLRDPRVNERDWGRLLRSVGYVPTWLFGAAALWLASAQAGAGVAGRWRAGVLLLAPAIAGGLAELVKIAVRRQRPGADSAAYVFRSVDVDFWSTRGLGMASSHTAVAFGAAAVLARCFPGTAPVWYLLAVGCAATRVLAGAHYLSDTVVAAALGWLVAEGCWRWAAKRARP